LKKINVKKINVPVLARTRTAIYPLRFPKRSADTYWNGIYPFIDYSTGGNIDGMIKATEENVAAVTVRAARCSRHRSITPRKQRCKPLWLACKRLCLLRPPELWAPSELPSCTLPSIETVLRRFRAGLNATFVFPTVCGGRDTAARTESDTPAAKGSPHNG
jgi:hypothetical protein